MTEMKVREGQKRVEQGKKKNIDGRGIAKKKKSAQWQYKREEEDKKMDRSIKKQMRK